MPSSHPVSIQQTYLSAVVPIIGTLKHSLRKVALVRFEVLNQACGVAQRVGYTGTWETDMAIYRLRVRQSPDHQAVVLPGPASFFVLEEGVFRAYHDVSEHHQHER
jgi:hypothetical protein